MRMLCSLALALIPCSVVAATDCEITEYPDHYEVVCIAGSQARPLSSTTALPPVPNEEPLPSIQPAAAAGVPDLLNVYPERVVRNDLARRHGAQLLQSAKGR